MSRYVLSDWERNVIDRLKIAGWTVVRQGTYQNLRNRVFLAEHVAKWEKEQAEGTRRWAEQAFEEQRRLADRLNRVCAAAAAQGVTIQAINAALEDSEVVAPV